ncbi:T9SS type A sorting domain-containing protein [Hymenobacter sp. J193]|uniref:T9SS type A sorting domain-containing protein n=1 Tax=Hymenobacter sp. J193 TaxID=2898429 RepID=UPI0035B456B5
MWRYAPTARSGPGATTPTASSAMALAAPSAARPYKLGSDTNWKSVAAGNEYSVGVRKDGTLWAWGSNSFGQLGLPFFSAEPLLIEGGDGSLPLSLPTFSARATGLRAAPVPLGSGAILTLNFTLTAPLVAAPLTLTDVTGRVLLRRLVSAPAGPATLVVPELAGRPAGLYIVRLVIDGRPAQVKVVKQ